MVRVAFSLTTFIYERLYLRQGRVPIVFLGKVNKHKDVSTTSLY